MDKDEMHKELEAMSLLLKDISVNLANVSSEKEFIAVSERNRLSLFYASEVISKMLEE